MKYVSDTQMKLEKEVPYIAYGSTCNQNRMTWHFMFVSFAESQIITSISFSSSAYTINSFCRTRILLGTQVFKSSSDFPVMTEGSL